ncbi:hypothetical protein [Endozoicomonas numazuensis]|uniref:PepSY domain-containing protein n=1 Tax=Endozoicomonas numazuensis TaxID=1137799 RepID=A0A081NFR9_9GAMM|nr:hypothetical protein [Endozoicomonas numazuensis]KEQ17292.1 hypothetical protein GZ78_15880 [Endozoicomonas numazuensis]
MKRPWLFPLSCSTLFVVSSPLVNAAVEVLPVSDPVRSAFKKGEAGSEWTESELEKARTTKDDPKIDIRVEVETDDGPRLFNVQLNEGSANFSHRSY